MIGKTNAGGGSISDVDFDLNVVGGTTEPSNPSENLMWVNTSTPINNWTISARVPDSPSEGDIWIPYSSDAPIQIAATKSNGLANIGIHSALQYESDNWVSKVSEYYKNSEWISLVKIFCLNGEFEIQPVAFSNKGTFTPNGNVLNSAGISNSDKTRAGGWFWDVSGQLDGYTHLCVRGSIAQAASTTMIGGFFTYGTSGFLTGYSTGYVSASKTIAIDQNLDLTNPATHAINASMTWLGIGTSTSSSGSSWTFTLTDFYLW